MAQPGGSADLLLHDGQVPRWLKSAVRNARLGREEELAALQRLDEQAQRLERYASDPLVEGLIASGQMHSPSGGRQPVSDWSRASDNSTRGQGGATS